MSKQVFKILGIGLLMTLIFLFGALMGARAEEVSTEGPNDGCIAYVENWDGVTDPDGAYVLKWDEIAPLLQRTLEFLNPELEMNNWNYPIHSYDLNYLRIEIERYNRMRELRRDILRLLETLE